MPIIVIMQGLPGSGKSTMVDHQYIPSGYQVICRDNFRFAMGLKYGETLKSEMEEEIQKAHDAVLAALIYRGCDIVIDECNVKQKYLEQLWKYILECCDKYDRQYDIIVHTMNVDVEECIRRRGPNFPAYVIWNMDKFLKEEGLPYVERMLEESKGLHTMHHLRSDKDNEWLHGTMICKA